MKSRGGPTECDASANGHTWSDECSRLMAYGTLRCIARRNFQRGRVAGERGWADGESGPTSLFSFSFSDATICTRPERRMSGQSDARDNETIYDTTIAIWNGEGRRTERVPGVVSAITSCSLYRTATRIARCAPRCNWSAYRIV